MSRGVPAEKFAEEGDEEFEVGEVGGAPGGEIGFAEIEDAEAAVGLEDAEHFAKAAFEIGKVAKAVADGDDIEGVFGEGKMEGVGLGEGDA